MDGVKDYFHSSLRKAVAEIGVAQNVGDGLAEAALIQARNLINTALDELRRRNHEKVSLKG